jgi:hypothetical protein
LENYIVALLQQSRFYQEFMCVALMVMSDLKSNVQAKAGV